MTKTTDIRTPEGTSQIDMVRDFDAPVALVWRCYTEPELLERWLGPERLEVRIDHDELRHGGTYQFTNRDPEDGAEYVFRGTYHGEPSPDLTMRTFEWLGMPGHVSLETMRMTEADGATRVTVTSVFQSVEDRDGMAVAMRSGVDEGYEKLDALLAGLI